MSWNFHNFLPVFGLWVKKFLISVEFSKWAVKTVLKCTVENLMKTHRKELKYHVFGGICVTNFPTSGKIFSTGLSKLKSMCPEDFLWERFFRRTFFGLRAVYLAVFGETIIEHLSKPFSTVFEDFLEKDFWIKKIIYF